MTQLLDVLIVGAGLSGLLAARALAQAGKTLIVLDKGVSVGGRMATRRIGGGLADHGAQFFTVRDSEFHKLVEGWLADGLVFEWSRGWSDGSAGGDETRDGHPRYAVRGGMNALPKHLAKGLSVKTNAQIALIERADQGWKLVDQMNATYTAKAVILTPPVPQSLALLDAGGVILPAETRQSLSELTYAPCVVGMFVLEREVDLPPPGALQRPDANLYWIGDNQAKGISSVPILTVQASPAYSERLYGLTDKDVTEQMTAELKIVLGDGLTIRDAEIKRWRYSQPNSTYAERCLSLPDLSLVFAGDAFGGPRVEGAVLSGLAAGNALL